MGGCTLTHTLPASGSDRLSHPGHQIDPRHASVLEAGGGGHESADAEDILSQLGATYPSGSPVGAANDAPTSTGGAPVEIYASYGDVPISLFETFQDAESSDSQLTFQITSNSNPSLFDVATINASSGDLILNAGSASGRSVITVRATDSVGLSTTATFRVDVNYVNEDPALNFYVESSENNTFVIVGYVTDDDNVEGLIVTFTGAFNLRATVQADGTFEFAVIVTEEEWGDVWGQVTDWQGLCSPFVERWVGVS